MQNRLYGSHTAGSIFIIIVGKILTPKKAHGYSVYLSIISATYVLNVGLKTI